MQTNGEEYAMLGCNHCVFTVWIHKKILTEAFKCLEGKLGKKRGQIFAWASDWIHKNSEQEKAGQFSQGMMIPVE